MQKATEDFWAALEQRAADRWVVIAEKMRAAGFDPDTGAVLLLPTNRGLPEPGAPLWVLSTVEHDDPMMVAPRAAVEMLAKGVRERSREAVMRVESLAMLVRMLAVKLPREHPTREKALEFLRLLGLVNALRPVPPADVLAYDDHAACSAWNDTYLNGTPEVSMPNWIMIWRQALENARKRLEAARGVAGDLAHEGAPSEGSWIPAEDVQRLAREIDVALNGEEGAARAPSLADVCSQVVAEARRRGRPLLAAPEPGPAVSIGDATDAAALERAARDAGLRRLIHGVPPGVVARALGEFVRLLQERASPRVRD